MHEIVRRSRQDAVRCERAFARAQESLYPLPAHPIVVNVPEQTNPIEGTEDVPLLESSLLIVRVEEGFNLISRHNMPRESPQKALEIQVAKVWTDLGQVLIRDLRGRLIHDILQAMLLSSLLRSESRQALPDGHEIARPE
jgi:hypothetical protein